MPQSKQEVDFISAFKDNYLKMQISKGTELKVPIWHSGMCEAFLIHVGSAQKAFKRKRYLKAYVECNKVYVGQLGVIKQAKTQLAELMTPLAERLEIQGSLTRSPL